MSDLERDESEDPGRDLMRRLAERDERSRRAHAAAAELMGLPAAERPGFAGGHPDCLAPEFVELMIAMARERRGPAPEESVAFAHLAATAAEAAHAAGADDVDDARALAFAELGNAHRICGDLRRAGVAFGLARERVRCAADPLVKAEVDSLEASYLDRTCDFAGAERLLIRAERIQHRCGSPHGVGRLRIQRGGVAQRRGDLDKSIELVEQGLELIDSNQEPRIAIVGVHILAHCLIEAGEHDSALGLLRRHRALYGAVGSSSDRARYGWLEGRAARNAGLLGLATATLEDVRDEFAELGFPYETALVQLDLAEIHIQQNAWDEAEQAAATTLALCQACGISQEGVVAASMLHETTRRRRESLESIVALANQVRRCLAAAPP